MTEAKFQRANSVDTDYVKQILPFSEEVLLSYWAVDNQVTANPLRCCAFLNPGDFKKCRFLRA